MDVVEKALAQAEQAERAAYARSLSVGHAHVGITTVNQRGEKVLENTAEVAQPPTVYAFTGQGSQEQGMGLV